VDTPPSRRLSKLMLVDMHLLSASRELRMNGSIETFPSLQDAAESVYDQPWI